MATTNDEIFNSLDPLGPEYGKINDPLLDSKGISPFEGNTLTDPKINFPVVPKINDLDLPNRSIQRNVVGIPPGKPGLNSKANFNDIKKASRELLRTKVQTNQDNNSYAKVYSYDPSPDGNAFYKRYLAYGQETFDKIGFSPLRDNEALFNSRTSNWQDFSRMMTHSFLPLFSRGFVSGPKSLFKMLQGDFTSTDLEDAKLYTESAAIGQSSKGGAFGFVNNSVMNFAYSAGIMTEAISEEIIGALLAPETLGGSFFLTSANFLKNSAKAIKGIDIAVDGYKAVNTTLNTVESVSGARKFWQMAKEGVGTSSFFPLQNTYQAVKGLGEVVKKGDQVYNLTNLAKAYKTAGGFYKDIRSINMALSEARLEAGMVENQVYDNLYNKYYRDNGKAPSDKEQNAMIKQSKEASLNTLYWNTALIYGTNAITFPNIVGPKGGISKFMKNTLKEFQTVGGGKFGNLGKIIYDQSKKEFAFQANNFKTLAKNWFKQPIYKSAVSTIGYFKGNFSEGIQENMQEIISGANEKYYTDSFKSPALKANLYSKGVATYGLRTQQDYMKEELSKQFTAQGFETFASGFFMGMLAAPINTAIPMLSNGYNRMFDKEAYQDFKTKKLEITKGIVSNLNSIDIKDFLSARPFNYATQDFAASIKMNGDEKAAADASNDAFLKQMDTVMETGTMEVFREKLADLKQLTPEEFEEAVPNVPKGEGAQYQAKIDNIIEKTKKIEKRYQYYNDKFPNPINAENLPPKDSPEYEDAVSLHYGWKKSIENAIYFNEAFEDTMDRKTKIQKKYLSKAPLKSMSQRDSEVLFDYSKLTNETVLLREEIKSIEALGDSSTMTRSQKEDFEKKKKKLIALENLAESTAKFRNFFNRYEKSAEIREQLQKQKGDEPVTDEEVDAVLDKYFGEFTDENKETQYASYNNAYKAYLKTLGNLNDDYIFDKDIDDSFILLADHQKLDSESRQLMKYVNLLHDPGNFLELADRNRKWMKDLYKKRGSIYEKMVQEELDTIIGNALLNALANKSIYISLDDFAAWQSDGTPPSEFYDHARKIIIPEGTALYNEYYMLFEQASELKNEKSSTLPESLDKELKSRLDELDELMNNELENVPKKEVRKEINTIYPESGEKISLLKILKEVSDGQFIEADYGGDYPLVFYKESDDLIRLDSKDGSEINPETVSVDFVNAKIYTIEMEPDPELADPIKQKYEQLKNKAMQEYALNKSKVEESEEAQEFVPITSDIEIEDIPETLYNSLYELFTKKYLSKLSDEDFVNMTSDQERNLLIKFIQSDTEAKELIANYNKSAKLDLQTKETGEKQDFEFMYQGKKIKTENAKTVYDLRKLQRRIQNKIDELNKIKEPTAEDITNKSNYMVIVADLEKLIATRSKKGMSPEFQEAVKKIQELQARQGEIEQSPSGYIINGILHDRVTKVIQELKGEKYAYAAEAEVGAAFYITIGQIGFNEEGIQKFIEELKARTLPGFSNYTYTELQKELESMVDQNLPIDEVLDQVQKIVSEKTYEESRISGNYIDNQIKNLFEPGQEPRFDDTKITQEAYDNLFGPDGYLTKLKQRVDNGELFIVSQGLRVFDTDLKIAGEIDLLVADSKGQITIVDVKTGEKVKWDNFKKKDNPNSKMEDYQLQQTAYANLLNRMIGVNPKVALLPIQMVREKETGKILSASKPTSPTLLSTDFLISLDKGPVQERIDSIIPPPNAPVSETKIEPSSVVPEDAESSDDVQSPAVESLDTEREEIFLADQDRFTVDMLSDMLKTVNTIDDLNAVIGELQVKASEQRIALDDLVPMSELIKAKQEEITSTKDTKIAPQSLQKGDELIAKSTIFTTKGKSKGEVFVDQDAVVIIKSIDTAKQTVTFNPLGQTNQMTIPFNKLDEMFILKDKLMSTTSKDEEIISPTVKNIVSESTDAVESFIKDASKLEEIEGKAATKSLEDLDDELLDDIDC